MTGRRFGSLIKRRNIFLLFPGERQLTWQVLQKNNIVNQIFHYTRCNTPKRVTSWRGPSPRHCARATQLLFEEMWQRWRAFGSTVSDLTGSKFKPQTSRSRDERVTARTTGLYEAKKKKIQEKLIV